MQSFKLIYYKCSPKWNLWQNPNLFCKKRFMLQEADVWLLMCRNMISSWLKFLHRFYLSWYIVFIYFTPHAWYIEVWWHLLKFHSMPFIHHKINPDFDITERSWSPTDHSMLMPDSQSAAAHPLLVSEELSTHQTSPSHTLLRRTSLSSTTPSLNRTT